MAVVPISSTSVAVFGGKNSTQTVVDTVYEYNLWDGSYHSLHSLSFPSRFTYGQFSIDDSNVVLLGEETNVIIYPIVT